MKPPTVGRTVHYHEHSLREPLAAIIVVVSGDGSASLAVFTGLETHRGRAETSFLRNVPFSEKPLGGHWSWPPMEET